MKLLAPSTATNSSTRRNSPVPDQLKSAIRAIRVLLDELNDRPLKKLGVTRRALYEQLDRPALRPLPATRYVLARWKLCRVNMDYHVLVEHHAYSVPLQLLREAVEVRYTTTTVEVLLQGPARDVAPATLRRTAVHRGRTAAAAPVDGQAALPGHARGRRASSAHSSTVLPPACSGSWGPPPAANGLWAEFIRRSFGFDVLECPRCGGRLQLIAVIEDPATARPARLSDVRPAAPLSVAARRILCGAFSLDTRP